MTMMITQRNNKRPRAPMMKRMMRGAAAIVPPPHHPQSQEPTSTQHCFIESRRRVSKCLLQFACLFIVLSCQQQLAHAQQDTATATPLMSSSYYYLDPCLNILKTSDRNNDSLLNRTEYATAVLELSHNKIDFFNDSAGVPIAAIEAYMNRGGKSSSVSYDASLCQDIYLAMYSVWNAVVDPIVCATAIKGSDVNVDGRMNDMEYLVFVNLLSNGAAPPTAQGFTFAQLPVTVQTVFTTFAGEGDAIDLTAAVSDPNYQANLCGMTSMALQVAMEEEAAATVAPDATTAPSSATAATTFPGTTFTTTTSAPTFTLTTPAPSAAPSATGTVAVSSLSLATRTCLQEMSVVDANKDEALGSDEFTILVNNLSNNTFPTAFRWLDPTMQDIYTSRQVFSSIPLPGLGSDFLLTSTSAQVDAICSELWASMMQLSGGTVTVPGGPTNPPVATEAPMATSELMPATQACIAALIQADDDQNSLLSQGEYSVFLNILGRNTFPLDFLSLDASLQNVFNLRKEEGVDVSVSGIESDLIPVKLVVVLDSFCGEVWNAIAILSNGDITAPETLEDLLPKAPLAVADLMPATQTCVKAMIAADTNADENFGTDEYTTLVNTMGGNILPKVYRYLDPSLVAIYEARRDVNVVHVTGIGSDPIPIDLVTDLEELCTEIWNALVVVSGGVINPPLTVASETVGCSLVTELSQQEMSVCKYAMVAEDANRDNFLDDLEWLGFVNRLTGNAYASLNEFSELPDIFQATFLSLGGIARAVNVAGSKPNAVPTVEDLTRISYICSEIYQDIECVKVAVSDASNGNTNNTTYDDDAISLEDFTNCIVSMAISDISRDERIDPVEYIRFLNRLSSNQFIGQNLATLPPVFQSNFVALAGESGSIVIPGTSPGSLPTASQRDVLRSICVTTIEAITLFVGGDNATNVTTSNQFLPFCKSAMVIADVNRDDKMGQTEYVRFISKLLGESYSSFDELDVIFQDIFDEISIDDVVDISGSKPGQSVSAEQYGELIQICAVTEEVIMEYNATIEGSASANQVSIFNSFIMSNREDLEASDLSIGLNRQGLDKAYDAFVRDIVQMVVLMGRNRRSLRVTDLKLDSPEIYLIENSECPEKVDTGSSCQIAFAKFILFLDGTHDKNSLSESFQALSQIAIDQGLLGTALEEVDPENELSIVSSSSPVTPDDDLGENTGDVSGDDSGLSMGAMIGIAVGSAAVVAALCIGIYFWYDRRKHRVAVDIDPDGYGEKKHHPGIDKEEVFLDDTADYRQDYGEYDNLFDSVEAGLDVATTRGESSTYELQNHNMSFQSNKSTLLLESLYGEALPNSQSNSFESQDETKAAFGSAAVLVSPENVSQSTKSKVLAVTPQSSGKKFDDEEDFTEVEVDDDDSSDSDEDEEEEVFDVEEDEELFEEEEVSVSESEDGDDSSEEDSDESDNEYEADTASSVDHLQKAEYRAKIIALVQSVVPSEIRNVDAMMEQFAGREEELIVTLQNMAETNDSSSGSDESDEDSSDEDTDEEEESSEDESPPSRKKAVPTKKADSDSSDENSSEGDDSDSS